VKLIRLEPDVYLLDRSIVFPDLNAGSFGDLICVGGDLSAERLLMAYKSGIFPWYIEDSMPYWFSPQVRMILFPDRFHISKSLAKTIRNGGFEARFDSDFEGVMRACSKPRKYESSTWIDEEFINGYSELFKLGYAHSIEVLHSGVLVGGLYYVAIAGVCFGESMFAFRRDASKVALKALCDLPFDFIDCQVPSKHLASLGGEEIAREEYLALLRRSLASA
jgi:leucyl/phenylalanyl-tRNA--protein transferase